MKYIKRINELFGSKKIEPGDRVMTPDGEGTVIPNDRNDGKIWVNLHNPENSNPLSGTENVYLPDEVKKI